MPLILLCTFLESQPVKRLLGTAVTCSRTKLDELIRGHFNIDANPKRVPLANKRWLSDEPDPRDLLRPFPAEPMRMWPISTRVNKPENDDPKILEPIKLAASSAYDTRSVYQEVDSR
jgi:hypothetical protein